MLNCKTNDKAGVAQTSPLSTNQKRWCVCVTLPLSEGSSLGLDHAEVPQRQVPAVVGLFVAENLNCHGPLGQKLHKVLRHRHRQLLRMKLCTEERHTVFY